MRATCSRSIRRSFTPGPFSAPMPGLPNRHVSLRRVAPCRKRATQHSLHHEILPAKSESYLFLAGAGGSDADKLVVDGETVIDQPPRRPGSALRRTATHSRQCRFLRTRLLARRRLSPHRPRNSPCRRTRLARSEENATMADAAVVAVGFDPSSESEGFDRSYELPFGQDELIKAVSEANPHTIVTITAGGNVDMHRWLDGVPALLHDWYPGQEGGRAMAQILTGQHSPEGHLPVSLERSWEENPVHDNYYAAPVPKAKRPTSPIRKVSSSATATTPAPIRSRCSPSASDCPTPPFRSPTSKFHRSRPARTPAVPSPSTSATPASLKELPLPRSTWAILPLRSGAPSKNSRDSKRFAWAPATRIMSTSSSTAALSPIGARIRMAGRLTPENSSSSSAIRRRTLHSL